MSYPPGTELLPGRLQALPAALLDGGHVELCAIAARDPLLPQSADFGDGVIARCTTSFSLAERFADDFAARGVVTGFHGLANQADHIRRKRDADLLDVGHDNLRLVGTGSNAPCQRQNQLS